MPKSEQFMKPLIPETETAMEEVYRKIRIVNNSMRKLKNPPEELFLKQ